MNMSGNKRLWTAIQKELSPRPTDAWPCWSHNSSAQFREDGFVVMYPYENRKEARWQVAQLAREFGQSYIYEFETVSELMTRAEDGVVKTSASKRRNLYGGDTDTQLVGKDGSTIVVPALPNGHSDVIIRRTISTDISSNSVSSYVKNKWRGDEPTVVMRRVKDLPVEDELTMREWEGPLLGDVVWRTTYRR